MLRNRYEVPRSMTASKNLIGYCVVLYECHLLQQILSWRICLEVDEGFDVGVGMKPKRISGKAENERVVGGCGCVRKGCQVVFKKV